MKTHILSVLLLTAALPLTAAAQTATTTPGGTTATQQDSANPGVTPPMPADGSNSTMKGGATTDSGSAMNNDNAATTMKSASAAGETFVTVPETGAWRVSDLQGKAVYGSDGANIGEIDDVLVSQDGSVNAVIIGVGGFLGIGEKDVAVNMSALQLGPGDTQAQANAASKALPDTTGATGATGMDATGTAAMGTSGAAGSGGAGTPGAVTGMNGSAATTNNAPGDMAANNTGAKIGDDGLPDRIILNVTRDQLEKAPAFEGVRGDQNK